MTGRRFFSSTVDVTDRQYGSGAWNTTFLIDLIRRTDQIQRVSSIRMYEPLRTERPMFLKWTGPRVGKRELPKDDFYGIECRRIMHEKSPISWIAKFWCSIDDEIIFISDHSQVYEYEPGTFNEDWTKLFLFHNRWL